MAALAQYTERSIHLPFLSSKNKGLLEQECVPAHPQNLNEGKASESKKAECAHTLLIISTAVIKQVQL